MKPCSLRGTTKSQKSGARATPNAGAHFRASSSHWCRLYMTRPRATPQDLAASSTQPTLQQQSACSLYDRRSQPGPCVGPFGQQHVHHAKGRCFQARTHNAAACARREADVSSFKIFQRSCNPAFPRGILDPYLNSLSSFFSLTTSAAPNKSGTATRKARDKSTRGMSI